MATKKVAKKKKYAVPMTVVHLVHKVQKHILEEPKRFDMDTLVERYKVDADKLKKAEPSEKEMIEADIKDDLEYIPACNTVACIAGWTALIVKPNMKWGKFVRSYDYHSLLRSWPKSKNIEDIAGKALGLKIDQATMFYQEYWPEPYRTKYEKEEYNPNKKVLAKIAVQRLDYYLRTGK